MASSETKGSLKINGLPEIKRPPLQITVSGKGKPEVKSGGRGWNGGAPVGVNR